MPKIPRTIGGHFIYSEKQPDLHTFETPFIPVDELHAFLNTDDVQIPLDRPYAWYTIVSDIGGIATFDNIPGKASGYYVAGGHIDTEEMKGAKADFRVYVGGWAEADAVLGGAEIIRQQSGKEWVPPFDDLRDHRAHNLGMKDLPIQMVISGSGNIDLSEKMFTSDCYRSVVFTTPEGENEIQGRMEKAGYGGNLYVESLPSEGRLITNEGFREMFRMIRQKYGVKLLDFQGGPRTAGTAAWLGLIDEYRGTTAPQLIGDRSMAFVDGRNGRRISVFEGAVWEPENTPVFKLKRLGVCYSHIIGIYNMTYRHL